MFAWTEQQLMIQRHDSRFRGKGDRAPLIDDLEYNGLPPYDILRKLFKTFGMDETGRRTLRQADRPGGSQRPGRGHRRAGA